MTVGGDHGCHVQLAHDRDSGAGDKRQNPCHDTVRNERVSDNALELATASERELRRNLGLARRIGRFPQLLIREAA
jgi:hypothetical protein